jgi:BirA family biotin operon repressor/biotin-[acetyl-CoA-carboxylase] ligase
MQRFDLTRLASSGLIARLEFHQSLPSTNDRAALVAAEESLACPALVLAAEQTAGRGRGGNQWWSAAGGLMFSVILTGAPNQAAAAPATWPGFSLVAGLAICEALEQLCPHAHFTVKWPNDVYANERKVCGILTESPAQARGRLIVGAGININNSFAAAPPALQQSALALCDVDGRERDLTESLLVILRSLAARWRDLSESGFTALRSAWEGRSLLTGRSVRMQSGPNIYSGRCLGIDDSGALLLQTEQGRQALLAGSVLSFE